ncbi:MAG: SurA N-terminal domain-containing protein [Bacteroidales bacterium]|nr:SurA N-terminal domain-containing protein [Bacteroidales bacterium]
MAIIGEIRKHYWLLVAIIGVALLLFVLSDFQRKQGKQTNTIGTVAGEKIAITEFNKRVEENTELQKANSNKGNLTAEENYQVRQQTWNQVVNEIVMNKQYDMLGVSVSVEELDDLVRGKNPHQVIEQSFRDQKTGQFDPKLVTQFLQNLDNPEMVTPENKQRYLQMEKYIKSDRQSTKYNSLVTKAFYVPTAFAKRNYNESNTMAQVRITGIPYQTVSDSAVKITDADYEKYYAENKYKFKQDKPARDIDYVLFEPKMSAEDISLLKSNIQKAYDEFVVTTDVAGFVNSTSDNRYDSTWHRRGTFSPNIDSMLFNAPVGQVSQPVEDNGMYRIFKVVDRQAKPDSLRASHILISYAGTPITTATRTREAASKLADSILNVVQKTPAAFEGIAGTISDDESAKTKLGDLGWFADGAMVPEFNEAVLKGSVGDIKKVETQFGYHIIKVVGKKDPSTKIKVASIDFGMEPGSRTIETFYNDASNFSATNNTMEKFEKAVKDKGMNLRNAPKLSESDNTIPGLTAAREVVRWSFNEETEKGTVSNVFDVEGTYVVAVLKNKVEKGIIPLDVLKEQIKPLVIREKKAEYLLKKVNDQFAKAKDLNAISQIFPNTKIDTADVSFASANIPNYGHEAKVTGQIFSAKKAQVVGPIQGEQGVYTFILDNMKEPPATTDFENQKKQMAMYFQGRAGMLSNILQEKADIKDNRLIFY